MELYARNAEQESALKSVKRRVSSFNGQDGLDLEELTAAFKQSEDCDKFLKAILFLIKQRGQLYTVDLTQGQNDDTNTIIFKNGASQALKGLDEDIKALMSQTLTGPSTHSQLKPATDLRVDDGKEHAESHL